MTQYDEIIRAYRHTDCDRLVNIWLEASRIGHPFLTESQLLSQSRQVRDIYLPEAENWVIERNGRAAGFIGLIDNFIGGLFIDPQAQGGGLGTKLIKYAAQLKGDLDVDVYAANPMAPAFYTRNGFIEVERRPIDDEGLPFEIIRMRRKA